jgi:hypothetical protein
VPFNGAGMFVRVRNWVADATAGIKIRADYHDIEDDGFADGLSQCIARDGQSVILANISMNSKRLIALADPVDPQDASTKTYADTKLPLTGDSTITGNLTVTGGVTAGAPVTATGYKTRAGLPGPYGSSVFNLAWTATGSLLEAWIDTTKIGALATQVFANTAAANAAAPKVNRAGDTMTGGLTVNGELIAASNYLRFGSSGGPGYIIWQGGGTYGLGGGGTIWHNGNLNPVQSVRLAGYSGGSVCTGVGSFVTGGGITAINSLQMNTLQYLTPGGWVTVGG